MKFSRRQIWLLIAGLLLAGAVLGISGAGAVLRALQATGWKAGAVVLAHLPSLFCAAMGWWVLLGRGQRPGLIRTLELRWIKESINALLPVVQVGGDVVRARLAVSARLPLAVAAASCIVDAGLGVIGLITFDLAGLAAAIWRFDDPRLSRMGVALVSAVALIVVVLTAAERLGVLRLAERIAIRAKGAFADLSNLGAEIRGILSTRTRMVQSVGWHVASWACGAFETWVALWAAGAPHSLGDAFILESLAQAVRAVGFAVPGALGVQEGGYVLLGSMLGIPADQALTLSLLRRLRELVLGVAGLIVWRMAAARQRRIEIPS